MKAVEDHLGNQYKSISEMCDRYNILPVTFQSRRKQGLSVKDSLTMPTPYGERRTRRNRSKYMN